MDDETLLKVVEAVFGENGRKIILFLLSSGSGRSDEEIGEALNMRVNDVRRILYELANHGFVTYTRSTKSGSNWHTYSWYTSRDLLHQAVAKRVKEVVRVLEEWLVSESVSAAYICPYDYTLYTFDDAFENNFRCLKCGAELIELDSNRIISYIKSLIDMFKSSA